MLRMTRARSHTWAVGISPLIQLLLEAVLCVVVSLVQGVRATFRMRFKHRARDWHTGSVREALPQTKPDIHIKEQDTSLEARPLARVPGGGRDPASAQSALPTRTTISIAPGATPTACHPGSAQRYPGPIAQSVPASRWVPALRFAAAGMTCARKPSLT